MIFLTLTKPAGFCSAAGGDMAESAQITAKNEPIREAYGKLLLDSFALFNQKQDERGPENVIRAGADGILSQLQERIERVRASLVRGNTSPEELRLNALDIAGFGIILTMILDGTWVSPDGRKPSTLVIGAHVQGPLVNIVDWAALEARVLALEGSQATNEAIDALNIEVRELKRAVRLERR